MATTTILGLFEETGLTVTVDIRKISDNSLVVDGASMTELADGAYKYSFTTYDPTIEYYIVCTDEFDNKCFTINEGIGDIKKSLWNKKTLSGTGDTYEEVLYDDDGTTPIRTHGLDKVGNVTTRV